MPDNEAIRYIAVSAIHKDEELTINYNAGGGSHISEHDTWFKKHNIILLKQADLSSPMDSREKGIHG